MRIGALRRLEAWRLIYCQLIGGNEDLRDLRGVIPSLSRKLPTK